MHILVSYLLLLYASSDRAKTLAGGVGTVDYYWDSNKEDEDTC